MDLYRDLAPAQTMADGALRWLGGRDPRGREASLLAAWAFAAGLLGGERSPTVQPRFRRRAWRFRSGGRILAPSAEATEETVLGRAGVGLVTAGRCLFGAGRRKRATKTADSRDKVARVVVLASNPAEARAVAEEIAHRARGNSGYFRGRMEALALRPGCTCPASPDATSGRP